MKLAFSLQIFERNLSIKFNRNPSSGSGLVSCVRTDMMELINVFKNVVSFKCHLLGILLSRRSEERVKLVNVVTIEFRSIK